jgi:hypothetical protein
MTFGTWRWWGSQPPPAAFTLRKCSWYSFSLGVESTPGPWHGGKEICQNLLTPPGIDPGTVRLVVQRPNHYATPGPNSFEPDDNIVSETSVCLPLKLMPVRESFIEFSHVETLDNIAEHSCWYEKMISFNLLLGHPVFKKSVLRKALFLDGNWIVERIE